MLKCLEGTTQLLLNYEFHTIVVRLIVSAKRSTISLIIFVLKSPKKALNVI